MARLESRKSHSWWWDSHISPKNSKWLIENLEEMDQSAKRMLKLIEEDGDSFAKKAEMYYQRRPELISLVEEFYRTYRSPAERYDHVTGELRKNIPTDLQSQGFNVSDTAPESESKQSRRKSGYRAAGFDIFLDGNSSDLQKEGDDSSTLADSDEESDDSSVNKYSVIFGRNENYVYLARIEGLLKVAHERIQISQEEIARLNCDLQKYKSMESENGLQARYITSVDKNVQSNEIFPEKAQIKADISKLSEERKHLEEQHRESESRRRCLEDEIKTLQAEKTETEEALNSEITKVKVDLSERDKMLDAFKLEKDAINQKIVSLNMEHVELIAGAEEARKLTSELQSKANHLEEEVEKQKIAIVEGAEEKREAIRQLCFSLEHYRNGYHQLRRVFMGHR